MHGLNTRQRVDYFAPISQIQYDGESQLSRIQSYSVDAPSTIKTIISVLNTSPELQVYVKRLYSIHYISNNYTHSCVCESYLLKLRYDIASPGTILGLMGQDAPDVLSPYISPLTGDDFRKQVKIVKSKRFIMKAGKTYKFKTPSMYNGRVKPINGDTEGNVSYNYRKGNYIRMWRYYGVPNLFALDVTEPLPGTVLSGLGITHVYHTYASYYSMDDATPDSTAFTSLAPNMAASNAMFNSTNVTTQSQSTEYRNYPYSVVT